MKLNHEPDDWAKVFDDVSNVAQARNVLTMAIADIGELAREGRRLTDVIRALDIVLAYRAARIRELQQGERT